MSRREDVDNSIWSDPDFVEISADAKLVYLWSFTNPHCGMAGLYKVSRRALIFEASLTPARAGAALSELTDAEFVFYDGTVLWVRSRVKHLRTRTEQIAKSIARDLEKVGEQHPFVGDFIDTYGELTWLRDHLAYIAHARAEKVNLNRGSTEPQPRFQGKGKGKGFNDNGSSRSKSSADSPSDVPPTELAEELQPALAQVKATLDRIHAERGGIPPTCRSVGMALVAFPRREHLVAAGNLEHWLSHGRGRNRKVRDVVAYFRNWLREEPETTPPSGRPGRSGRSSDLVDILPGNREEADGT